MAGTTRAVGKGIHMVHRDVASGGTLAAVSVAYFLGTRGMPAGQGEPGPAFLPVVLSVALLVLGLVTLVGGVRATRRAGAETDESQGGPRQEARKAWAAVGLTFAYVWLFHPLGFVLSTLAYTFGVTALFRRKRSAFLYVLPPLCTLAVYLFFRVGLGARLPSGPFG